jgi:hypothetical protein
MRSRCPHWRACEITDGFRALIIVDHKIEFISLLKQDLFMLRRDNQSFFKLFCRYVLLQNHRLYANDGFRIYMTVVILVSATNVNE